tara:strand:+ start:353 stop:853 length:501 start_codon:yes stop_codon:yes gene_type:complete
MPERKYPTNNKNKQGFHVTSEGLSALQKQLEELKAERPIIAEKLRAAMADKDFRENAPLDAARDEQAHLEAKIRENEDRIRNAVIVDASSNQGRADVGSKVKLFNLKTEKEQVLTLVSPAEVDPLSGKISTESPIGLALRGKSEGDEIIVKVPSGEIEFRVIDISS